MTNAKHTASGAALTEFVLEVFRLNGRLLAAGDRLVADVGLSSARWQVLGAISYSEQADTVSGLARRMGLTRQAVQRLVNELQDDGLVAFKSNPAHQRAQLVTLTRKGEVAYAAADLRQKSWINELANGITRSQIQEALKTLAALRSKLERDEDED